VRRQYRSSPNDPNAPATFESGEYVIDRSSLPAPDSRPELDLGRVLDEHDFLGGGFEATFELNDKPPASSPKKVLAAVPVDGAGATLTARHTPLPRVTSESNRKELPVGAVVVLVLMGVLIGIAVHVVFD
jgi:hypothetical protein